MKKISIILATYGEVSHPTLGKLYSNSLRILNILTSLVTNLSKPLKRFIAVFRTLKRKIEWSRDGYRPMLNEITKDQRIKLQTKLKSHNGHEIVYKVYDSYYFTEPYLENTLKEVKDSDKVIVVPMIPVESAFSCGVACKMIMDCYKDVAFSKVKVLKHLWNDHQLIEIFKEQIFSLHPFQEKGSHGIVLVAHGTLIKDSNGKELNIATGYKETLLFFDKLKSAIEQDKRNQFDTIKLGVLNHKFGGEWMSETLENALIDLKTDSIDNVSIFPFGFFSDNSESDYEAKGMLDSSSFQSKTYIRCVNSDNVFIEWLANKIKSSILFSYKN